MERFSEIETYITPMWNEWFAEDRKKIHDYFQQHRKEIAYKFCDCAVKQVVPDVCALQSAGEQGEIAYLGIHFLRSSHLNRSYDYEIKLYNEILYLDENRAAGYWYPEFLYRFAADEEEMLKREIQGKFIRVKPHEIEQMRQKLFLQYQETAKPYFQVLVHCLWEKPEFRQVKTSDKLQFLYGEHMGELEELAPEGDV